MVAIIIVVFLILSIWYIIDLYKDEEVVTTKEIEKKNNDEYNKMVNSIFFGQIKKELNKINERLLKSYSYIGVIYVYKDYINLIHTLGDSNTIINYRELGYKNLTDEQCVLLARAIGTIEGYTYKVKIDTWRSGKEYAYNRAYAEHDFWKNRIDLIRNNRTRAEQERLKKPY